jgi:hypothetical protein
MATYYWVGGTGTWNGATTTNWSASSGGAGGAGVPNSSDTVIFDANSGTGTCTTASGAACFTCTLNSASLALVLGSNLTMAWNFVLTAGALAIAGYTLSARLISSSNTNARSIAFGSNGNLTLTGNAEFILSMTNATNFTYTGTSNVNLTYSGATSPRNLRFGNGGGATESNVLNVNVSAGTDTVSVSGGFKNLNFTGFSGSMTVSTVDIYEGLTLSSTMTVPASTSPLRFFGSLGTRSVTTNGVTLDCPITVDCSGAYVSFSDALTQGSTRAFTFSNGTVKLKNGVTSTVGAFATSGTNQKFLQSTLAGSQATLSQASGTVSASYLTIQDIAATGGATWQAFSTNNSVDAGNNSGWDFSSQLGKYIYTRRKNKRILP